MVPDSEVLDAFRVLVEFNAKKVLNELESQSWKEGDKVLGKANRRDLNSGRVGAGCLRGRQRPGVKKEVVAKRAKSSLDLPFRSKEEVDVYETTGKEEDKRGVTNSNLLNGASTTVNKKTAAPRAFHGKFGVRQFGQRLKPPQGHNLDLANNRPCSKYSIIDMLCSVEEALKTDKYSKRTEHLVNRFKERIIKDLSYNEEESQPSNAERPMNRGNGTCRRKKIRVYDCSGVKGFTEELNGFKEYNFKTKSYKATEETVRVVVIPEVDPISDIVETSVEKELRRSYGLTNVKKEKRDEDPAIEKVLLHYGQSAIERYAPVGQEYEIDNLFMRFCLPLVIHSVNAPRKTLSDTYMRRLDRVKLEPKDSQLSCRPMSDKYIRFARKYRKKKSILHKNIQKRRATAPRKMRYNKSFKKHVILQELEKQMELACPSGPNLESCHSKSLLNFKKDPVTYINLTGSRPIDKNTVNDECDPEEYTIKQTIQPNEVIDVLGKVQDVLMNFPDDLFNDRSYVDNRIDKDVSKAQNIEDISVNQEEGELSTSMSESSHVESEDISQILGADCDLVLQENTEESYNVPKENISLVPFCLQIPWYMRMYISPVTGRFVGYSKRTSFLVRFVVAAVAVVPTHLVMRSHSAVRFLSRHYEDMERYGNSKCGHGRSFVKDMFKLPSVKTIDFFSYK